MINNFTLRGSKYEIQCQTDKCTEYQTVSINLIQYSQITFTGDPEYCRNSLETMTGNYIYVLFWEGCLDLEGMCEPRMQSHQQER